MTDPVNTCPNQMCTHSPMVHHGNGVTVPLVCEVEGCTCTSEHPDAQAHTPTLGRVD